MLSIESYRAVAMLLIVFLHANVIGRLRVEGSAYGYVIELPLNLVFWITVPFFFLVSGYFFGRRVNGGDDPRELLGDSVWPLLVLFGIWAAVYSLIPRDWVTAFYNDGIWTTVRTQALKSITILLNEHIKLLLIPRPPVYHLWFLPGLILGLATVTAVLLAGIHKGAEWLIAGLYGLMLAAEIAEFHAPLSYPISIPLLAMLCTLVGWWLSEHGPFGAGLAAWLIVGGCMLAYAEGAALKLFFHASRGQIEVHGYVGGILMVTGMFLLALAHPTWGQRTTLPYIGRLSLGVYLSHMLILDAVAPIHFHLPRWPAIWHVVYGIAVFGLSLLFTVLVSHIPVLRWCVVRIRRGKPRVSSPLVSKAA